jgi:GAF domain-containing protein
MRKKFCPPAFAEARRREPVLRPGPKTALGRAVAIKQTVQIADVQAVPGYFDGPGGLSGLQMARLASARTVIAVPMPKDNELIGAVVVYRQQVRPFTDKQIALVTTFADQAVIAVENTRLLNDWPEPRPRASKLVGRGLRLKFARELPNGLPGARRPMRLRKRFT